MYRIKTTTGLHSNKLPQLFSIYLLSLGIFLFFALPLYSEVSRLLAWLLFVLGTIPLYKHIIAKRSSLPLIEIVLLNYILFFALPVFHQDILNIYIGDILPSKESIELTLFYAVIAIIMLQYGYHFSKRILKNTTLPQLHFNCNNNRLFIFAIAAVLGRTVIALGILPVPATFNRVFGIFFSSDLGIALAALLYYAGYLSKIQRLIAICLLSLSVTLGLASGMSQSFLQPLLIWFFCYWFIKKKTPYIPITILIITFLLLQPVKFEYRERVWQNHEATSFSGKVTLYSNIFINHWFSGSSVYNKSSETTSRRLSLLMQTAHLVDTTPKIIPYKNGSTLTYMIYTWIPRFLWPGKPIAQQTNIDFAIEYGIQSVRSQKNTRFGIGHLGETYINFGIIGVVGIFFVLGFFYYIPFYLIPINSGNIAGMGILTAVLINFIIIESTISNVFGSIFQQLFVQAFLLKQLTGQTTHRHQKYLNFRKF